MKSFNSVSRAFKTVATASAFVGSCSIAKLALATSLHPCTPSVAAQPIQISCKVDSGFEVIKINTLMSKLIPMSQGENYFESQTAVVTSLDGDGEEIGSKVFFSNEFSFTLSATGDATFASTDGKLKLDSCVTPLHGAVSFGN